MEQLTRGLRNNNPANIRLTKDRWLGMSDEQTDKVFVQFDKRVYGIRALMVLLRNYYVNYNLRTVRGIIGRFAPPNENDTSTYIAYVARVVGKGADDEISSVDFRDEGRFHSLTLLRLCHAICLMESGYRLQEGEFEMALSIARNCSSML